jgi:hypothetical protein
VTRKRHDRHDCSVIVTARILLSDLTRWRVEIKGSHVPAEINFVKPDGNLTIAESVKDSILKCRDADMKPYEVFRHQITNVREEDMEEMFADTRHFPSDKRVSDFIKNTEKRHSFQGGQWTAVHNIAVGDLKREGILLLLQNGNTEEQNGFVMSVSNVTALRSARINQHVLGIDGKHGLQDDGAILMTAVTQHKDGFGCPASFTIMNREHTDNILLGIRSILDNVPCDRADCAHTYSYTELQNEGGWRRTTDCANLNPYRPLVMIDKFEASANACQELGLTYILCWFHIVKAVMERLKQMDVNIGVSYIIILAFKLVARSGETDEAEHRWSLFIEVNICCSEIEMAERKGAGVLVSHHTCISYPMEDIMAVLAG